MQNLAHSDKRKSEIVKACRALYKKMNFKEMKFYKKNLNAKKIRNAFTKE